MGENRKSAKRLCENRNTHNIIVFPKYIFVKFCRVIIKSIPKFKFLRHDIFQYWHVALWKCYFMLIAFIGNCRKNAVWNPNSWQIKFFFPSSGPPYKEMGGALAVTTQYWQNSKQTNTRCTGCVPHSGCVYCVLHPLLFGHHKYDRTWEIYPCHC